MNELSKWANIYFSSQRPKRQGQTTSKAPRFLSFTERGVLLFNDFVTKDLRDTVGNYDGHCFELCKLSKCKKVNVKCSSLLKIPHCAQYLLPLYALRFHGAWSFTALVVWSLHTTTRRDIVTGLLCVCDLEKAASLVNTGLSDSHLSNMHYMIIGADPPMPMTELLPWFLNQDFYHMSS